MNVLTLKKAGGALLVGGAYFRGGLNRGFAACKFPVPSYQSKNHLESCLIYRKNFFLFLKRVLARGHCSGNSTSICYPLASQISQCCPLKEFWRETVSF